MKTTRILIIGGGPAGLGAAWRLHKKNSDDWLLLEAEEKVGGLSASFVDDAGFTWDLGGHVIHSHYQLFDQMVAEALPAGLLRHQRQAFIRMVQRWIPYPFQDNLHRLPAELRDECIAGLLEARQQRKGQDSFESFEAWVQAAFGSGITDCFMRPYNRKVWCCELGEMSASWIGDRVSLPDIDKLIANTQAGIDDDSYGPNSSFTFPERGGTGGLWDGLAGILPSDQLLTGQRVQSIDVKKKVCLLSDGQQIGYQALISTMPLTHLVRVTSLSALQAPARKLQHNRVEVFGLGLAGAAPAAIGDFTWTYFPEDVLPCYRITVFSNYSPHNVPLPGQQWSLMMEVGRKPDAPEDSGKLWEQLLSGLSSEGMLPEKAGILSRWHRQLPMGYPLPTRERDQALSQLLPVLEAVDILPRGRFGAWKYEVGNMDHCFMQGVEAVDRILDDKPEQVLSAKVG
jgi:protoporphyrinogen oxidase